MLWKSGPGKVGRPPAFETPEALWAACTEYFEWVEANPLQEAKAFSSQGTVLVEQLPKMRAMTIVAMCTYIGIRTETWFKYREKEQYQEVIERVENIIWAQKFEGASAGLLNHAIIVRELGLAEKTEHAGKNGGPIEVCWKEPDDGEA